MNGEAVRPLQRGSLRSLALAILLPALLFCCTEQDPDPRPFDPHDAAPLAFEVNPFIGTDLEGQTFPGAVYPWGMASPSPHTRLTSIADLLGMDFLEGGLAFSGYKWGDPTIHGFGTAHLSGVGCPDLGGPVVVPFVGDPPENFEAAGSAYRDEIAHAGYYSVQLDEAEVVAEMTATPRSAALRFRFEAAERPPGILIDTSNGLSVAHDGGYVRLVSDTEVEGYAKFGLFCGQSNQGRVHFVARIEGPVSESGLLVDGELSTETEATGNVGAYMRLDSSPGDAVSVAIGLSWVSVAGARANLDAEQGGFDDLRGSAERAWQQVLERVEVEGGSPEDRRAFYSALYHLAIHPNIASDVDGGYLRYPAGEPATSDPEQPRYTVFSLWDTYRSLHPLLTLLYPERQLGMLRTLADMATSGAPPRWELWGEEVQMMVGDPAAIVVADSLAKGLDDFDVEALFETMYEASTQPAQRPGVESYLERGYIPMEEAGIALLGGVWGPASTTLEYAFADWSLARVAERLGQSEAAAVLAERSIGYRALYDEQTGTLRPRMADGSFLEPYDPEEFLTETGAAGGPGFVEGTGWQYAFMVPHDIEGLIDLHGGGERFLPRLEALFDQDRFTIFNEPDIAYPYLFTYLEGEATQTQREVRRILAEKFGAGPDGIPGNDDSGTMSSWFAFSAMGFYPATPGLAEYRIGSPLFERITLKLSEQHYAGARFVVEASGNSKTALYVQSMELNGVSLATPVLSHGAVVSGGTLRLEMGTGE